MDPELPEQAEMDVQHLSVLPSIEQMFAPCVDAFDLVAVEPTGAIGEPSLG